MISRDGRIECIEEKNLVITTFHRFGYVYAYDINGDLEWAIKLEPFQNLETTEEVRQGRIQRWSVGLIGSYVSVLSNYHDELIMVQTITNEADQRPKLTTLFLHPDNGKTIAVYEDYEIPWTLNYSDDRYFVKVVDDSKIELDVYGISKE